MEENHICRGGLQSKTHPHVSVFDDVGKGKDSDVDV